MAVPTMNGNVPGLHLAQEPFCQSTSVSLVSFPAISQKLKVKSYIKARKHSSSKTNKQKNQQLQTWYGAYNILKSNIFPRIDKTYFFFNIWEALCFT